MVTELSGTFYLYIGTYTQPPPDLNGGQSKGIYVYQMNPESGELMYVSETSGVRNPSYLAIDPQGKHLYAVNEVDEWRESLANAYAINQEDGTLEYLNQQSCLGHAPCYAHVDGSGGYLLIANYGSGDVTMLPILETGELAAASDHHQHKGSSINPRRQEAPHAHCATTDPSNGYAFVADLGIDKIMTYRLDLPNGKLIPNDPPYTEIEPGAGPRHLVFHPNGSTAYLIRELDSKITALAYDADKGTMEAVQTISTLPEGYKRISHCADIHVHPSGRYLYGSNRGHDSIAMYRIDEATGKLQLLGHQSTLGATPRNFVIDPGGNFLLAANQDSHTVVTFRIDRETGLLEETGWVANIPTPVCLKFLVI